MNNHARASLVQREVWAIPICRYIFYILYSCRRALGHLFIRKYARSLSG